MHDNWHLGLLNQINDLHDILSFFFFGKPYYARKLSNSNNHCTQAMSQCNGSTGTNCYLDNINSLLQSRKQPSHIQQSINNMRKPLIANICYLFTRKKLLLATKWIVWTTCFWLWLKKEIVKDFKGQSCYNFWRCKYIFS